MQGLFVSGSRPKSKKAVKEALAEGQSIRLEATSWFGNEYDGFVTLTDGEVVAPHGTYHFVGPNPHTDRRFYGTIVVSAKGVTVK